MLRPHFVEKSDYSGLALELAWNILVVSLVLYHLEHEEAHLLRIILSLYLCLYFILPLFVLPSCLLIKVADLRSLSLV